MSTYLTLALVAVIFFGSCLALALSIHNALSARGASRRLAELQRVAARVQNLENARRRIGL